MAALITNAGLAILSNRIKGSGTEPNYTGWGTSATAEAVTQTTLVAAASESRVAGTSTVVTVTQTNDTYQVAATITCAGAGKTIQEVGLFDAITTGNMLMRAVHTAKALNIGDQIAYTIKVTSIGT